MKKLIIKIAIIILIIFIVLFLTARFIGTKGLKIKEYKIVNNKITEQYHGLKVVHISDMHFGSIIHEKELNNLVSKINLLKPDIVVLTGDLIDERIKFDKDVLIKYLSMIESKLGKYAVTGNHDLPIEDFNNIIESSGFVNLDNTYKLIYNSVEPIIISGISSNLANEEENIAMNIKTQEFDNYISLTDKLPIYSILLMHEPDYIDELNLNNYDLVLSGHSHNGQIRLPIIGKLYTPKKSKKYYDEYYKINNTDFYISSGLGTSKWRLRLFNKPSFNFYRITNK